MTAKFTKGKRVVRGIRAAGTSSSRSANRKPLPSGNVGGFQKNTKCKHQGVAVGDGRWDKSHAYNCISCGLGFDGFLSDGRVIVKGGQQ